MVQWPTYPEGLAVFAPMLSVAVGRGGGGIGGCIAALLFLALSEHLLHASEQVAVEIPGPRRSEAELGSV